MRLFPTILAAATIATGLGVAAPAMAHWDNHWRHHDRHRHHSYHRHHRDHGHQWRHQYYHGWGYHPPRVTYVPVPVYRW